MACGHTSSGTSSGPPHVNAVAEVQSGVGAAVSVGVGVGVAVSVGVGVGVAASNPTGQTLHNRNGVEANSSSFATLQALGYVNPPRNDIWLYGPVS